MTKPCTYCNKEIELVKTEKGWRPFNPGDLTPHKCPEGDAAWAVKRAQSAPSQKNEKLIAKEVCMKEAAETYRYLVTDKAKPQIGELDAAKAIVDIYRVLRDALLEDEKEVSS